MMNKIHRWSSKNPLPIHINEGPLRTFLLICPEKPPNAKSSEGISVSVEKREHDWLLEFTLNNPRFESVFTSFYEEVCEKCWNLSAKDAAIVITETYCKWKNAFSSRQNPLSKIEIQGLLGELIAIRDLLLQKYDASTVLNSWTLLDSGKQDFIFPDNWFEIKTTHVGSNVIKISSIEQLDCINSDGYLIVIILKTTTVEDPSGFSINNIIDELYSIFSESGNGENFLMMLKSWNLPSDLYESYRFVLADENVYLVDKTFPHLSRSKIPSAVGKIQYELYLQLLEQFMVK